jgi:hypothetical protein
MRRKAAEEKRPFRRRFFGWVERSMEIAHKSSADKFSKAKRNEFR